MMGRPVWLASVSRISRGGKIISALKLPRRLIAEAQMVLFKTLLGVGDHGRERCFQMCITTCLHRALSDDELAGLPQAWCDAKALDIAGGPVRVLRSVGIPAIASVEPCEAFERSPIGMDDAEGEPLWMPIECGTCEPCQARKRSVDR